MKNKKQTGLGAHFRKLRQDLKGMTFKEKADHIWTYYKEYFFFIGAALLVVVGIVYSIIAGKPKISSSGLLMNVDLDTRGYTYLTSTFEKEHLRGHKGDVQLTQNTMSTSNQSVDAIDASYTAYMSVLAAVDAETLDYLIMDIQTAAHLFEDKLYMDLRDLLDEETLAWLAEEDLLLYRGTTEGSKVPECIRIDTLPFGQDCLMAKQETYLAFIANTPREEACLLLWEHILDWKTPAQTGDN